MKLQEMFHHWLVKRVFHRLYTAYRYPYKNADSIISALAPVERLAYYKDAKSVLESQSFIAELRELTRHFVL